MSARQRPVRVRLPVKVELDGSVFELHPSSGRQPTCYRRVPRGKRHELRRVKDRATISAVVRKYLEDNPPTEAEAAEHNIPKRFVRPGHNPGAGHNPDTPVR